MTTVSIAPTTRPADDSARATSGERVAAALVCIACGVVLGFAAWLNPAPAGHGTHTQLGLPACPWPAAVGGPCPTCGMTTSFAFAAHGQFGRSFDAQPFGFVLALLTAAAFWASLHIAATGSPAGRMYARLMRPRALWVLTGLALAAWGYKWATWS